MPPEPSAACQAGRARRNRRRRGNAAPQSEVPPRQVEQLRNRRRRDRHRQARVGQHAKAIERVAARAVDHGGRSGHRDGGRDGRKSWRPSAAIEAGAIAVVEVADGTIDGRFETNNGRRLEPKSAVRRKPTIISHSSKRPRKSSKSIVSTWE